MKPTPEAIDRSVVHTLIVIATVLPLALVGGVFLFGLAVPVVAVPGVRQAATVEPNAISDEYLKAFARGWVTRRHTLNALSYESVALAIADDCTPEFRMPFLKAALAEFQNYRALEKTSSGSVDHLTIETLAPGVWQIGYRVVDDTFYGAIGVGRSEHKGQLILTLADPQTSQRPVQVADDIILAAKPSSTHPDTTP